jgi:maltose alpha-D-glucosyltransferase/alpha-amylase
METADTKSKTTPARAQTSSAIGDEALWYKDAVIYELRVGAFSDNAGKGVGNFRGLTERLDYLQDLGITVLWLLPFYPSPARDDGYDIADYTSINPEYGTIQDFKVFLKEAHERGIKVVTELVLNHTSDQHPWFQRARRAPAGSELRDFYVWNSSPEKFRDVRIIFEDFETSNWQWDGIANAYYWHRFFAHQPDLNFDNPLVRKEILKIIDFWMSLGVDGFRLDAVPYLFEREGTGCENLPETHAYLKELRAYVDKHYKNRMLLAEANQWPEDAAAYFGQGDECHMAFHFPVMPRMFMAAQMEDRFPLIDIFEQTPALPDNCQWGLFLRNHDELTLEMVTDEERDYMVRMFASNPRARLNMGIRRRLAPLLGNNRRKIELLNGLLFSLPGTPVLYYGDEIGMGDNIYLGDRNGVRTPMQWSADRNAGFSRANSQRLYLPVVADAEYHYEALNVEAQQANPHSLLWWMKRLIALRKRYKSFGRGTISFLQPDNRKVLAFVRQYQDETILVVANLSRFAQYVELDLAPYKGMHPVELFGQTSFPTIGELPYLLTMASNSFLWFLLEKPAKEIPKPANVTVSQLPMLNRTGSLKTLFDEDADDATKALFLSYIQNRRWFGGKGRRVRALRFTECVPFMLKATGEFVLAFAEIEYFEGDVDTYALPIGIAATNDVKDMREQYPQASIANVRTPGDESDLVLYDAMFNKAFCLSILEAMTRRRTYRGTHGVVQAFRGFALNDLFEKANNIVPSPVKAEQSNTSIVFGDKFIFKLYRKLHNGTNPDLEIGQYLTDKAQFTQIASVAGYFEYQREGLEPVTLGLLQTFVPNQGDAWEYSVDQAEDFLEKMLTKAQDPSTPLATTGKSLALLASQDLPASARDLIGPYIEMARLLGQRTGELHQSLAHEPEDERFTPEPFTTLYQRSLYQSMRNLTSSVFSSFKKRLKELPEEIRPAAEKLIARENKVIAVFQTLTKGRINASRIRIHGDFHLGQVLFTGKDFVIVDFEGEPAVPLSQRKIKRSPFKDVAGMFRSFQYAAQTALSNQISRGIITAEKRPTAEAWADYWVLWTSVAFLKSYLEQVRGSTFLPVNPKELDTLIDVYTMAKVVYELGYELNNRPDWLKIPLEGINRLLGKDS